MFLKLFIVFIFANRSAFSEVLTDEFWYKDTTNCTLPPYPDHGSYVTPGRPDGKPGSLFGSVYINVTCDPGYVAKGPTSVFCYEGHWSEKVPECIRYCKLTPHPSVTYYCIQPAGNGNDAKECEQLVPSGMAVRPECKEPNYYHAGTHPFMRCIDGVFDYIAICELECGTITPQATQLIANGVDALRAEVPWHVGVYRTREGDPQYQCGGSLVSTSAIISVAHCYWDNFKNAKRSASEFVVAAGKLYQPWDDLGDEGYVQKRDVKNIELPPRFHGQRAKYQEDIAVLIVNKEFELKTYLRPVCLNFDSNFNKRQLRNGNLGKFSGWGFTEEPVVPRTLQTVDFPYIDIKDCLNILPTEFGLTVSGDKVCAGYTNGTAACNGDSGGGLTFPSVERGIERYYLRGVLSIAPSKEGICDTHTVAAYTEVLKHQDFIQESIDHSKWLCADNTTISASLKCNGKVDCPDGSDESTNTCGKVETKQDQNTFLCIVPEFPEHGTYKLEGYEVVRPGMSLLSLRITVECRPGYMPQGPEIVTCDTGKWSSKITQCSRGCTLKPLQSPSVEFRCTGGRSSESGVSVLCDERQPIGALVRPDCKSPYYSPQPLPLMRCVDGDWDIVPRCIPQCGIIASEKDKKSIVPYNVTRGEFPWHATIYTKKTKPYSAICGGTIVTSTTIITAAHCFWSDIDKLQPASNYAVAVGKLYKPWNNKRDSQAQKIDVKSIKIPTRFYGAAANYQDDIAVVLLAEPIVYSCNVLPVCLDFDVNFNRRQLKTGNLGKVVGFGLLDTGANRPPPTLKSISLPYMDVTQCMVNAPTQFREYITSDKICAGFRNGTDVCKGDGGGGLVFPESEQGVARYFLRGVMSTSPEPDQGAGPKYCHNIAIITFTELIKHEHFIRENMEVGPSQSKEEGNVKKPEGDKFKCKPDEFRCGSGECVDAASTCDGIKNCKDGSDESDEKCPDNRAHSSTTTTTTTTTTESPTTVTSINNEVAITEKCRLPPQPTNGVYHVMGGDVVDGEASFVLLRYSCYKRFATMENPKVFCSDGVWSLDRLPQCLQTCHLERHESIKYNCIITGTESTRPCNDYEVEGTVIQPTCREPNYYTPLELPYMVCRRGQWSSSPACVPECGTLTPKGAPLVLGGETAKFGDVPWHAGIYHKNIHNGTHTQICGGSLISNSVVLSAAHCFWNEREKKLYSVKWYAVAVGKLHRDWDNPDDEPYAQKSDVEKIVVSKFYQGVDLYYRDDIAIVMVSGPFEYQTYVRPVCLDFRHDFAESQLQSGVVGKAAGWGLTTGLKGSESPELKVVDMPYMSYVDCVRQTTAAYKQYITYDKICAGDIEGIVLCRGDSGGGLAFPETVFNTVRFYIRGIASTSPPSNDNKQCNTHSLTGFTSISKYQNLIKTYWLT